MIGNDHRKSSFGEWRGPGVSRLPFWNPTWIAIFTAQAALIAPHLQAIEGKDPQDICWPLNTEDFCSSHRPRFLLVWATVMVYYFNIFFLLNYSSRGLLLSSSIWVWRACPFGWNQAVFQIFDGSAPSPSSFSSSITPPRIHLTSA